MTEPTGHCQPIVLLGAAEDVSAGVEALCAALGLDLIQIASPHELPYTLHNRQPFAVICAIIPVGRDVCQALRSVASYDRELPVLVVTGDDPAGLGAVDAAEQLWRLTGLRACAETPEPQHLMQFLFEAGRAGNSLRLLPVA